MVGAAILLGAAGCGERILGVLNVLINILILIAAILAEVVR